MSSNGFSESLALDLALDLVTTPADVKALRELRAEAPSWFALTSDEIDAILPEIALDRRPTARAEWEPSSLA